MDMDSTLPYQKIFTCCLQKDMDSTLRCDLIQATGASIH